MFDRTTGPTEESPLTELTELSAAGAPRRFVLCAVDGARDDGARDDGVRDDGVRDDRVRDDGARDDGVVLGRGMALDDEAIACMYAGNAPSTRHPARVASSATCSPACSDPPAT